MDNFSNKLKKLRKEKDVKQKDVANVLNISASAYGFYEQGKRTPTSDMFSKLADYFDVSVDYLLGKTDNPKTIKNKEEPKEKDIEKIIDELMSQQGLMLCGEPMSEQDMILLRNSIRSTIEMAKNMKNKK